MIEDMLIWIKVIPLWILAQPIKMIKILRGQCLIKRCKNKAIHFGIDGHRSYGMCDDCYNDYKSLVDKLQCIADELQQMGKEERYE